MYAMISAYLRCSVRLYWHMFWRVFLYQIMFVSVNSKTTGITSGAETATLPEHLSSSPGFNGVCRAQSLVFSVVCCRLCFVLVLSVLLRYTASYCPFGIFKLFSLTLSYVRVLILTSKISSECPQLCCYGFDVFIFTWCNRN
jgi:hypothetical protein